ncbi:hypothetical protein HZ994_01705 [Akkermansiaceae bacterium]|nr:hypothetical protein HZ994_01705 [Akkermansiaceae bacterium]
MHPGLKALLSITGFAARHFLVVVLAVAALCILWTLIYFGLLILSIFMGGGLGSPLTYPAGLLGILLGCMVIGWGVFAPASGLGAVFCRLFKLPKFAAIPFVVLVAFALSHCLFWFFVSQMTTHPMPPTWIILEKFCLFLTIPLGAYWWITEGPGAILDAIRRIIAKRRTIPTLPRIADQ